MKSEREEEGCKIKKKVHGGRDGDLTKLGVREEKLIENSKKKPEPRGEDPPRKKKKKKKSTFEDADL